MTIKEKFIKYVKDPSLGEKNINDLRDIVDEYPYFQVARLLLAKALYQTKKEIVEEIQLSAVYTLDRNRMHLLLNGLPPFSFTNSCLSNEMNLQNEAICIKKSENSFIDEISGLTSVDVSDIVYTVDDSSTLVDYDQSKGSNEIKPEDKDKGKDVFLLEAHNELGTPLTSNKNVAYEGPKSIDENKLFDNSFNEVFSYLCNHISNISKQQPKEIKNQISKEQKVLIEKFINQKIKIIPNVELNETLSQKDFTQDSSIMSADLATENLAQIMLQQGNEEKALDIYEKLILKFPQKKTYLAKFTEKLNFTKNV